MDSVETTVGVESEDVAVVELDLVTTSAIACGKIGGAFKIYKQL